MLRRSYDASPIKRLRSTRDKVKQRRDAVLRIITEMHPMTVRQVYYQAVVRGLVEKTDPGYTRTQNDLVLMRRDGTLSYSWLVDNTRWQRKPQTYDGVQDALDDTARFYRKSLWADADCYVEIWLEKDELSGVIYPVTEEYDVSLMVARGYASLSFLYEAAEYISRLIVPAFIYHLGDSDTYGIEAGAKIEQTLRELAPDAEIHFKRLAVTNEQIKRLKLPTRKDRKGKTSVELDALTPGMLRYLVREAIEQHLPRAQFEILKIAEESERELIGGLVGMLKRKMDDE
jgi:hypothetical protein